MHWLSRAVKSAVDRPEGMHLFVNNMTDPDIFDYAFDADDINWRFDGRKSSLPFILMQSLCLKSTTIKIPGNIVERLWHIDNVTSYEDFQFKM